MAFVKRKLDSTPKGLGEKLRALRRGQAVSLDMLEESTHIQSRYLVALEHGDYDTLPEPLYTRNFIKAYARALGADSAYFLELYDEESGCVDLLSPHRMPRTRVLKSRLAVWHRTLSGAFIAAFVLGVLGYVGYQVSGMLAAPSVMVTSPEDGSSTTTAILPVTGKVERGEVSLRVNGEPVTVNDDLTFSTTVDLSRGLNVITVEAARRYSQTAVLERHVVLNGSAGEGINTVSMR